MLTMPYRALSLIVCACSLLPLPAPQSPPPASVPEVDPLPAHLSETGYFRDLKEHVLADGFRPYDVVAHPWADGASKARFVRVPTGSQVTPRQGDSWAFPVGTVFLQTLTLPGSGTPVRTETRVIRVTSEGLAFSTFVWASDHSEATQATEAGQLEVRWDGGYLLWRITSPTRCVECHRPEAKGGSLLGLTTEQLAVSVDGHHQLAAWVADGILDQVPAAAERPLVQPYDDQASLQDRARSYLHANCAPCHRPEGKGSGTMDLRWTTPHEETGLGPAHEVVLAGQPFDSWIYLRMIYDGRRRMPTLLTHEVDRAGAALIKQWVESQGSGRDSKENR